MAYQGIFQQQSCLPEPFHLLQFASPTKSPHPTFCSAGPFLWSATRGGGYKMVLPLNPLGPEGDGWKPAGKYCRVLADEQTGRVRQTKSPGLASSFLLRLEWDEPVIAIWSELTTQNEESTKNVLLVARHLPNTREARCGHRVHLCCSPGGRQGSQANATPGGSASQCRGKRSQTQRTAF